MRVLMFLSLIFALPALAQTPCTPVIRTGNPAWTAYHAAKKADTAQPTIVFLGDSITQHWQDASVAGDGLGAGLDVWNAHFAALGAWQAGGSGDTTRQLLWRIGDGVLTNKGTPEVFVLEIGTNNLGDATYGPSWAAHGIIHTVWALRVRFPQARIIVLSILPRSTYWSLGQQLNALLADYIPKECGAVWLDATESLSLGGVPNPALYQSDGVHLTAAGYEVLAGLIDGVLSGPTPTPTPAEPTPTATPAETPTPQI
jgi:lysophospholipase L1-like esterase